MASDSYDWRPRPRSFADRVETDSTPDDDDSDPSKRPKTTFMCIIAAAIFESSDKRLSLQEIYQYVTSRYPYYSHANRKAWQNAVRHNLSLHDCFVKIRRAACIVSGGQVYETTAHGGYWTLDAEAMDEYAQYGRIKRRPSARIVKMPRRSSLGVESERADGVHRRRGRPPLVSISSREDVGVGVGGCPSRDESHEQLAGATSSTSFSSSSSSSIDRDAAASAAALSVFASAAVPPPPLPPQPPQHGYWETYGAPEPPATASVTDSTIPSLPTIVPSSAAAVSASSIIRRLCGDVVRVYNEFS